MKRKAIISPELSLVCAGAALLFIAYWLIFALTTDDGVGRGALQALNNTLPALGLAWVIHLMLFRYVWNATFAVRLIIQIPLSILFAFVWYIAILVIRELREGWLTNGFSTRPFVPVAFAWQMFQGVTFYALTAVTSLAIFLNRRLHDAQNIIAPRLNSVASTILARTSDGTESVQIQAITLISGAGDYSEISLPGRAVLSTTTLAEFEMRLPQDQFFRAHRSHIIRLDAIERSEPGGNGRTIIHLTDGRTVTTSRAGTRLLREAAL